MLQILPMHQNNVYKIISCFVLTFLFLNPVNAQSDNTTFDEYKKRVAKTFDNYSTNITNKYSDYLRGIWEKYKVFAPLQLPLDDIVPVRYDDKDSAVIEEIPIEEENLVIIEENETAPIIPNPVIIEKINKVVEEQIEVSLYNTTLHIRCQNPSINLNNIDKETIAQAWEKLQDGRFQNTIYDCLEIRKQSNLCDWAYLNLIQKTSLSIFKDEHNKATLLSAFLLLQSGYNIRIGKTPNELCLLFTCKQEIYNCTYCTIEGERFYLYAVNGSLENFEICNAPALVSNAISLQIEREQDFATKPSENRRIQSTTNSEVCANVSVNENLLEFYSTYPTSRMNDNDMTRWAMYAQTPIDKTTREPLYNQLRRIIKGKSTLDAANILLDFVQTGFIYKLDDEVWGEDRAFFAEESLFYPYCDCEDRSILFSHLIRDLLYLDVALVYSPGHMFTAVNFSENVEGTYIIINDKKFVVCEPTCTNGAPVGWSDIEDGTEGIEVIVLDKIYYEETEDVKEGDSGILNYPKSLFPICVDGMYGYKDKNGKVVIPCQYDSVSDNVYGDLFLYVAEKDGILTLYDYDGYEVLRNVQDYIPIELNEVGGTKIDFYAIVKLDNEWRYIGLILGPYIDDFSLQNYDMTDITYEKNIYCCPIQGEDKIADKFIILKKKDNNKYGVLNLNTQQTVIPFVYDNITFKNDDKSQVCVFDKQSNVKKIIPIK